MSRPENLDWMSDPSLLVERPELSRRRRFWIRVYLITALASLVLGAVSAFYFN